MRQYSVLGVNVASATLDEVVGVLTTRKGGASQVRRVHFCNTYTFSLLSQDHRLRSALTSSDLNVPDGVPVALLGWRSGQRGPVRGPSVMARVLADGQVCGVRHFFYGGRDGVVQKLVDRISAAYPGVKVVGSETPPFRDLSADELGDLGKRIDESGADVVWIGLGTPRQDHLVDALSCRTNVVLIPVGAAFDFLSGDIPEAPKLVQGSGFEWLYRLSREPRRLWRRYLLGSPKFMADVLLWKARSSPRHTATTNVTR